MRSRLRGALPLVFDDLDGIAGGELEVEVVVAEVEAAVEAEGLEEDDFLDFFFLSWERGVRMEVSKMKAKKAAKKERIAKMEIV